MRPVLLEMTGFAAFREHTLVDFTGADYFALVGPTGSGKSTVIDALTFALYGSVPRWDNPRSVANALAPTQNRGAVRLVFDVGAALDSFRAVRRLAGGDMGRVIPGHDPEVMRRYPAPRPELEGIVARLD